MKKHLKGIFITATDTEVGKTFTSALLLKALLKQKTNACYFKPVASGCETKNNILIAEDLLFIEKFTGVKMVQDLHCPLRYKKPLAPMAAAKLENKNLNLVKIKKAFERLEEKHSVLVVEGIGGIMVPFKNNYLVIDLIAELRLPALIVSRPSLGTINHTLLTINALKSRGIPVTGFLTNGHKEKDDEAAATSPEIIAGLSKTAYLGHIPVYDFGKDTPDDFIKTKAAFINKIANNLSDSGSNFRHKIWR